jgi:hypothetical protein
VKRVLIAAVLGALTLGNLSAQADELETFNLNGTFADDNTAFQGTLTFDFTNTGVSLTDFTIMTAAGHGPVFPIPAETFTSANSIAGVYLPAAPDPDNPAIIDPASINIGMSTPGTFFTLTINLADDVSPGASDQVIGGAEGAEGERMIAGGALTPVPLPPTLWLLAGGLAMIGLSQRHRGSLPTDGRSAAH